MSWQEVLKLLFPYLLEVLRVVLNGPHKQAVNNLREKGMIKDK